MIFIHQDPQFSELLRIVADERGISGALVEKDYWVTHVLWALHDQGFDIWFKGGTSLSKGFDLIQRFSEDLDLRIDPGRVADLPPVANWKSDSDSRIAEREAYFEVLGQVMRIPDVSVIRDRVGEDKRVRSGDYRCKYPSDDLDDLPPAISPFVRLEVGRARVEPHVDRAISSFIHEHLVAEELIAGYHDTRLQAVRCVHPLVTLYEKLDAICRRYEREAFDPAGFVRHYEDAARIIAGAADLPELGSSIEALGRDLVDAKALKALPVGEHPAFRLDDKAKRAALDEAHEAIRPMFWRAPLGLEAACETIRGWLAERSWNV